jgi:hypothetical protein
MVVFLYSSRNLKLPSVGGVAAQPTGWLPRQKTATPNGSERIIHQSRNHLSEPQSGDCGKVQPASVTAISSLERLPTAPGYCFSMTRERLPKFYFIFLRTFF